MSSVQPLFSIASITYNSGKWVSQTIESVLASTFTDFEFLISDDCSADNSWDIIQQYHDPRIRSWRNENNLGEYANRNKVLREARGKYILFVDGDDMLYKNTLQQLSIYVHDFPEAIMVWGVWSHQLNFCVFPVLLQPVETMNWIYAANLPIAVMGFGETLFNVDVLLAAGGFSEAFISGDTYIKKRLALEGPVLLVPIGFMFWRRSAGQASNKLDRGLNGYMNNVLIDRNVLATDYFSHHPAELGIYKHNCLVRDIKILFRRTFLKGKLLLGFRTFRQLHFSLKHLSYLFKKADLSYHDVLVNNQFKGRESTKT